MQAHPTVLIDSGYITRNLTLAAGSISVGGCAVASVDGSLSDHGEEETFCYAMPVGTESPDHRAAEDALCAFVRQKGL